MGLERHPTLALPPPRHPRAMWAKGGSGRGDRFRPDASNTATIFSSTDPITINFYRVFRSGTPILSWSVSPTLQYSSSYKDNLEKKLT